ncbi:MAG TPA: DUF711 family protein [Anaerolineaceae bacterium]|nr:DUF711 family protein [Anaerolineaceae bacterium]HPN49964.1 DUF711 family protein [Anaerolineaceae bacterium]
MKIRSITCFHPISWPLWEAGLHHLGLFAQQARQAFTAAGFEVQSLRLATTPFCLSCQPADLPQLAREAEEVALQAGFDYISLGPALLSHPESYAAIPDALAVTKSVFFSGMMADPQTRQLSLKAVRACARIIHRASTILPDGFANLRFTALGNVTPGAPFFPAAYHQGPTPAFSLALESSDVAIQAFKNVRNIDEGRQNLVNIITHTAANLEAVAQSLRLASSQMNFGGLDFTFAPYPEDARSSGAAIEQFGIPAVGLAGSLAASAILTEALGRIPYARCGFNGLMLPQLEDSILARRAAEGYLTTNDLLLYSAVCGTGLDTIALPGDSTPEQISALLLDVAALSLRLDKPLTARLMPIPGKKAGEETCFDFSYFANSRILPLRAQPLTGIFGNEETFELRKR